MRLGGRASHGCMTWGLANRRNQDQILGATVHRWTAFAGDALAAVLPRTAIGDLG